MSKSEAWEKVEIARNPNRKTALDYIESIFDNFIELHGDRCFGDDKAMVCGIGSIGKQGYTIIAEQKGRSTKENIERNFGMPNPESYRKAIRFMKQAEKFNRPIITFVDTKGAYPGIGAEERGQGEAIAKSMFEMARLKVPIITIVIGEGSSGGALAISVANKIIMLENSIYSILSPEGYASILWKDSSRAKEAAEVMKNLAKQGKKVLFVATKKQAKQVVADKAASVGMPYVIERWPGGMLTNFPTIRKAIKKMTTIDKMTKDGTFDNLSKREKLQITRQRAKLEKTLGSIVDLTRLPSALFVVDVMKEHIAVREANRLGIPVFGMVDTNSNPNNIDYVIPANDDATKSVEVILGAICEAMNEGLQERKAEKIDTEAAGEGEGAKRERKAKAAVKKERTKKEDEEALNAKVADKYAKDIEE